LGSAWAAVDPVLQIVSVTGTFGLSLLTCFAVSAPGLFFRSRRDGAAATLAGLILFAGIGVWGAARIPAGPQPLQPGIRLRLIQASIPQTLKSAPGMREHNFLLQMALTRQAADRPPTHIVWPESAAPYLLEEDPRSLQALAQAVPPNGLMLVGSVRGAFKGDEISQLWNSLRVIDAGGAIIGSYDKAHLVPFGEYVPPWLPVRKLVPGNIDFTPGPGPQTLDLPGLPPVAPMICYEAIFPGAIVDEAHRPAWILNVSNDGWFGISSGPYQHFAAARMRAIEEGLPVIRNANNGISGAIDPYGRVIARLGLDAVGVLDTDLPQPLPPTLFSRMGSLILAVLVVVALGLGAIGNRLGNRRAT
jgi:apolipoprotein N-acyltransferase